MSKKVTKSVILAYPYAELRADGKVKKNHEADATVTLDRAEANRLLRAGLARVADDTEEPGGEEPSGSDSTGA